MTNDAAVLLLRAGQKSRNILEGDQGDIERIAEAHKPRTLDGSIDIKHSREKCRLIRHNAN